MQDAAVLNEVKNRYRLYINPAIVAMLEQAGIELVEERSEGCYIYASNGQRYLDCLGGYGAFSLGHRPKEVVKAVGHQLLRQPQASHVFYNSVQSEAAELLAKLLGWDSCGCFFANSGAEAVEGSLKLARLFTGRRKFVAMENSFHGKTFGALSATGRDLYRRPFEPLLTEFVHIAFGDIAAAEAAVDDNTAAVIVEAVQGEGGIIIPPDGYISELARVCHKHGALLICDEVQCGLGRTGEMFGYQHDGASPDIVALAKALGGGVMPIGAFLARQNIFKPLIEQPFLHTSTFGGSQLACAAAKAALEILLRDYDSFAVKEKGELLLNGLNELKAQFPDYIKAVRGRGLMLGVEFFSPESAFGFMRLCLDNHILVAYTLNNPAVIRFEPPFIITNAILLHLLAVIKNGLFRIFSK